MSQKGPRIPQYKVSVVGDGATGKTSMLSVYAKNYYPEQYNPTVFDTTIVNITVGKKQAQLELWDTAGQEDYDRLRPMSYPDTHVVLLVFSISQPDSLVNAVQKWLPEIEHHCPNVPVLLIGTKRDLRLDSEVIQHLERFNQAPVSMTSAKEVAKSRKTIVDYLECSAKQREGLTEIFEAATQYAMAQSKPKACCSCSIL